MPATMADVARRSGTSTAVVSYVINDGPRPVAPETRERVLAAATELGYRPNRIARALRSRTSGVVGVVLADAANPYFGALARHLEQELVRHDKLTLIGNTRFTGQRQQHLVERFVAARVDGLVIASEDGGDDVAARAETEGVPAIYVHNRPAAAHARLVPADNDSAVEQAVAHLRGHGHDHVAFLAGPHDEGPVGQRRQAWQRHARGGASASTLRCGYSRAAASELVRSLAVEGTVPAALIAATDEQAIGVLAGAWVSGVRVPEDLAVISLDGSPDSAYTSPALTVTEQPLRQMAATAIELLLSDTTEVPAMRAAMTPRASCGCAW